ncbi:MAG: serine/threonine-protein kinase [Candidatus Acidiferrales bacterium]
MKELFGAALEVEREQRGAFLRDACGSSDSLRIEVESLLSAYEKPSGLSEPPWAGAAAEGAAAPRVIGPYHLLEKLGEGGMGQVWLAEQSAPVRRRVALKLIRGGIYDSALLQRFQSERQSLAIMDHPAIAKVFDAGTTEAGQPYFVMEYVAGLPITEYCDQKKLSIRERIDLFIEVCEGVQHAHRKAIIHRDLKPANILVVEVNGRPMPRIIDFGLAKAVSGKIEGETFFTQAGGFMGTPGYMSPEQSDPGVQDVDTRTDVYSLGVVLYVLLAGCEPFDASAWKKLPLHEALRRLREEDVATPSTKLSAAQETCSVAAAARGVEPKQLVSQLRGDLDWITIKAVEKDQARRYGSVAEFAADLRHYLNNEPVLARPASAGYRLQKYVRRHRLGVASAALIAALLISFGAIQAVQLRRITRERDRASHVTDFMTSMFKVSDPSEARGNSITAREILDRASKEIDSGLAKDPELQAQMMDAMGQVYRNLGLYSSAHHLFERSADIWTHTAGPEDPHTLAAVHNLALTLGGEGRYPEAEKLEAHNLEVYRRVLGPERAETIRSMSGLAVTIENEGRYPEAEKLAREALALSERTAGVENPDTLRIMNTVGDVLGRQSRFAEAEPFHNKVLEIRRRDLGPEHPDTLYTMHSLANDFRGERKYAEAEKLDRETLETRSRVLGPEHQATLGSMRDLARDYSRQGKFQEAEKMDRQALAITRRALGPEHPETASLLINLTDILTREGQYAEAEQMGSEAIEIDRRALGPEHAFTLAAMNNLTLALAREGKFSEAEPLARSTLEAYRHAMGPNHPDTLGSMDTLVYCLYLEHRYADAEKMARDLADFDRRVLGPEDSSTAHVTYNLAAFLALQGKRDEALSNLRQSVEHGLAPSEDLKIESDADLRSLHGDPRFAEIVGIAKQRAAAAQGAK